MGVEPENTLRSFVAAEQSGLDMIELDLRLSKDGALVVMHDADVDRTTDGTGPIAEKSLAELRALDAVGAPLQAEIKDTAAARALAEVLERRGLADRVEVSSFHEEAIAEITRLVPGVRTALIASRYGTDVVDDATRAGASTLCLDIRRLTLEIVERARKADLRIIGWVVNTQDQLRLVRALELDGATTDYPQIKRTGRFTA